MFCNIGNLWQPLAIVVAGVVAYISWNQYRIARLRLRLDLFDKRYKVFDGARRMISHVVREAQLPVTVMQEYWTATTDRRFLFGDDVVEYLEQLDKHASRFHAYNEIIRAGAGTDPAKRSEAIEIEHRELEWLSDELLKGGLQAKFAPYLRFDDVRR